MFKVDPLVKFPTRYDIAKDYQKIYNKRESMVADRLSSGGITIPDDGSLIPKPAKSAIMITSIPKGENWFYQKARQCGRSSEFLYANLDTCWDELPYQWDSEPLSPFYELENEVKNWLKDVII